MQDKLPHTKHFSTILKLLIVCCQPDPTEEEIVFIRDTLPAIDSTLLATLANKHCVFPLVHKSLHTYPHEECPLSHKVLSTFKSYYMKISQHNMLMSAELIQIIQLLATHNIKALAFKGPALSQMAYGDITLRQFGDLDILIRKKDRTKMMQVLIAQHYVPEINLKEATKETFFNCVNVIGLHKESTGILVEIHWELLSKNYAIDWEEKSLWDTQKSIKINQKDIPVLSTEQHLLYLCAHGSKHLFERLEWICDIDRSIRANKDLDWELILSEAEKLGIRRMLYLGLVLSQQFFRTNLPESIQEEITQDKKIPKLISKIIKLNFSKDTQASKNYSTFGLLWSMRESFLDQLRFAWRGMFAPKFDDFKYIQLPSHLSFLYPLVRPFRLMTKYFKS